MRASPQLIKAIDEWRRRQPDLPSRSEAARRLLEHRLVIKPTPRTEAGGNPVGKEIAMSEDQCCDAREPAAYGDCRG